MIRLLFLTLILCSATIAGAYGAAYVAKLEQEKKEAIQAQLDAEPTTFEYLDMDLLSAPILEGDKVAAYFLTRAVYVLSEHAQTRTPIPLDILLRDSFYTAVLDSNLIDFRKNDELDIDSLTKTMIEVANREAGHKIVYGVLFNQFNIFEHEQVRKDSFDKPK